MKQREVVFVEGLSWTKAHKKLQISKVRAHARVIGLQTLELRRKSNPSARYPRRRGRKQRGSSMSSPPGQERPLRPLAPATDIRTETKAVPTQADHAKKISLVIRNSPGKRQPPKNLADETVFKFLCERGTTMTPDPYLRGYRKDPFHIIPANSCQDALDFYIQHYVPNSAALYHIFNVTNIYTAFPLTMLQNSLFLYAGLANALHELEFFLHGPGEPSQRLYVHLGLALSNLRRELQAREESMLDDISVATVVNLAVVARQLGDQVAHKLHKQHLRSMIQARGGLDALGDGGLQKVLLLQWEGYWSWAAEQGPTIFPGDRHNPGTKVYPKRPFSENMRLLLALLPLGYQDLAGQGNVLTLPTLEVLIRTARADKDKKSNVPIVRDEDIYRSKHRRYHDLMQACPALAEPVDKPTLEKLIVIALILFCSATFCKQRLPTRHTVCIAVCAGKALARFGRPTIMTEAEVDALLWVYMVVIDSWRSRDGKMRMPGLNLLQGFKAHFPDLVTWEDVDTSLQRFFWTDDMSEFVARSWGEV